MKKVGTSRFLVGLLQVQEGEVGCAAYWWCPRCDALHMVTLDFPNASGATWQWDTNYEAPTLTPSVLTSWKGAGGGRQVCHCWVKGGKIEFCGDTTPSVKGEGFAGRTVMMPELPEWFRKGFVEWTDPVPT